MVSGSAFRPDRRQAGGLVAGGLEVGAPGCLLVFLAFEFRLYSVIVWGGRGAKGGEGEGLGAPRGFQASDLGTRHEG